MHDTHPQSIAVKRTPNTILHTALMYAKNKELMFEHQAMSREYCASFCNRPHGFMPGCSDMAYLRQLGVKTCPPQQQAEASVHRLF
jgi:hypothetical protein